MVHPKDKHTHYKNNHAMKSVDNINYLPEKCYLQLLHTEECLLPYPMVDHHLF